MICLRAGEWSAGIDPEWGTLHRITYCGWEVLRGISAPVRDPHWGTVPPRLENVRVESAEDGTRLDFEADCASEEIRFRWRGGISLSQREGLAFHFEGWAGKDFLKNRIGFCVLHPADCAGRPCVVEHGDGSLESSHFPRTISPHQPFSEIRSLRHDPAPGLRATVRMEGDVFEMEDQRNWTDASFKTYCTPLARPVPVEILRGETVRQSVHLTISGQAESRAPEHDVVLRPLAGGGRELPSWTVAAGPPEDLFANFAEFNRQRPARGNTVRFGMNPQMHAFDERSLIETLEVQASCVREAVAWAEGGRVEPSVSFQPEAHSPDPRWNSPLAGAWILASLKYVSEAGASAVRIADAPGPGSAVEAALEMWRRFAGFRIQEVLSSDPCRAVGIQLADPSHRVRIAVSLTRRLQSVRWDDGEAFVLEPWSWKIEENL